MISKPVVDATLQAALTRWVGEQTHQGVFVTDASLRLVFWNRWMEIHSGLTAAEVLDRRLFEVYPDATSRGIHDYYEQALEGRVTVLSHGLHRYLVSMPPTNSEVGLTEMPQTCLVGPLSNENGIIGTVTIVDDVSDRLASENVLRKQIAAQQTARAVAEKALRAKDQFLSTLSHEMRTPLNAVLGWARILLTRTEVDRQLLDRALHVIERNAAAQAKMIDDLLDMSRIVAGKLRLELQPVDLVSIMLAAIDVIMPTATAKRISIKTSLDPKTPGVLGDADRLQQSVWNLLSNALKFTESGGVVEVRLESTPSTARIVVRDTGCGISEAFLPHVFERFRQDDASSSRRHGGLGLGLALVREIVELHGGTVGVMSAGEGQGSTFIIDLPTAPLPEPRGLQIDADLEAASTISLEGVRVLIVDDESDSRDLAVLALAQRQASVLSAPSSEAAIEVILGMAAADLPHVVVSDIGMPMEDGYQLIRRIRSLPAEHGRHIPAIAVTGYATRDDVERALAAGYQLHVSKPVDPRALVAAIAGLVAPRAAR